MLKKKVCIIAQFPPPLHGLSKAVDTLYRSNDLNGDFELVKVDIADNKKFLSNFIFISKVDADLFYFTISQSLWGNVRDLLIMFLLMKRGKKCLIHLHGGFFRKLYDNYMCSIQKKLNRIVLDNVVGSIVLSNSLRGIFKDLVKDSRIFVVPNCVDNEYVLSYDEMIDKVSAANGVYHVLYLSNFIRSKGYDIVLNMAKEYQKHPFSKKLHFDFAGSFFSKEERCYFENYVQQNGIRDIVTYHGTVFGNAKKKLLKTCTFFALPSKYPKEGQPISILEAMANGMVVLTTNHAGIPDVVKNEINGCVVNLDEEIVATYLNFIESLSAQRIAKIGLDNYETIQECYLENSYISNLKNCFNQLTE